MGGLKGIAISHPHYYTTMVDWSRAFGDIPVHLHEADKQVGAAARSRREVLERRDQGMGARR